MESKIKAVLQTKVLKPTGQYGGGCICQGEVYLTDNGKVFVKTNYKPVACAMFEGEMASLEAIRSTNTVRVPRPLHVVSLGETGKQGAALVMEALEMAGGKRGRARELGIKLAKMHDHNRILIQNGDAAGEHRFGFPITTFCGLMPLDNSWKDDWISFYVQNRIEPQVKLVEEKHGNRHVRELWTQVEKRLPEFFQGIEIVPALLHGDLWSGNKAELSDEPVIFDPGSFFGHAEFDFGIMQMFGGFSQDFYDGYHSIRPKQAGFERRRDLYELFHQLNHWNHFGSGYKGSTIALLGRLRTR